VGGNAAGRRPEERSRVVTVLVDEPALDRPFDYLAPEAIRLGDVVRVDLHGRRVRGWVVALDATPPAGVALKAVAKVSGWGPAGDVVALAAWAAWRWAGQPVHFLRTATAPNVVAGLPASKRTTSTVDEPIAEVADALAAGRAVLRLRPSQDPLPIVRQAAALGPTLVVCASLAQVADLAHRLRAEGRSVAEHPRDWAQARAGVDVVIGARAAAWAPCSDLAAVVVLDEHEQVHQEESSPTWHARDVAAQRAADAGVPCVVTSPCPSVDVHDWPTFERVSSSRRWPAVQVVDRKREDPLRSDLYSTELVDLVRSGQRVVCVLNRKGRAALLVCAACSELARCESCAASVALGEGILECRRCATTRPVVCQSCGGGKLKQRRLGVSRAREDLQRLARVAVGEVTGDSDSIPDSSVLIGTEAVLRRLDRADAVAFLDLDAELLAPRYRAGEEAMALLARAARIVGPTKGRLLLQTRQPDHEVVRAAVAADPSIARDVELERRRVLRFPPFASIAHVSGAPAAEYVDPLRGRVDVEVLGPADDGTYLVRAADVSLLCDALDDLPRPAGRLRVAVDPVRL
jgi:primosomal protein N' (replication factor Y)